MPLWASGLISKQLIQGAGPPPQLGSMVVCQVTKEKVNWIGRSQSTQPAQDSCPPLILAYRRTNDCRLKFPEFSIVKLIPASPL